MLAAADDEVLAAFAEKIAEKCAPPATSAGDQGYLVCPAPCSAAIADYSDVVDCLACLTENELADVAGDTRGTPDAPADRDVKNCARSIGRGLDFYLGKVMREQQVCQYRKDLRPNDSDCAVDDPRGRILRAADRVERLIARCEPAAWSAFALGSCAPSPATCLLDRSALAAQTLFRAVYEPEAPAPNPTVTPTSPPPTATGLNTPSPTPTSCGVQMPMVDPVTSPTDQLEQVITGSAHVTGSRYLSISSEAGVFYGVGYHGNFPTTVTLLPNQVNHLTVCLINQACGDSVCTTTDYNGSPLEILQQP
jgi:hypothetical protein